MGIIPLRYVLPSLLLISLPGDNCARIISRQRRRPHLNDVRIAIADKALDELLTDLVALRNQRAASGVRAARASDEIAPDLQPTFEPTEKQGFFHSVGNLFKKAFNIESPTELGQNNDLQSEPTISPFAAEQKLETAMPMKSSKNLHQLGRPKPNVYSPQMKLKTRFDSDVDKTFLSSTELPSASEPKIENKPYTTKPLEDPAFLLALGQAAGNVFNLLEEEGTRIPHKFPTKNDSIKEARGKKSTAE